MADAIIPKEEKKKKFHMIMLFFTAEELGLPTDNPDQWVNVRNIRFDNAMDAMDYYANTQCPASVHISADTAEELEKEKEQMIRNYQDKEWLEENLYPYL